MEFKICILSLSQNINNNIASSEGILKWFQDKYPKHLFKVTESVEETLTLQPNPDLVIVLLNRYYTYDQGCLFHPDPYPIALRIKHLRVIYFGIELPTVHHYTNYIENSIDLKNNKPMDLEFHYIGTIWLNKDMNTVQCVGFNYEMETIFKNIYKQRIVCYLMIALNCNYTVTDTLIKNGF